MGICQGVLWGVRGKGTKGYTALPWWGAVADIKLPHLSAPTHALSTAPHLSPGCQAPRSQIGDSGLPVLVSASRDSQAQSAALSLDQLHHGDAPELLCRQTGG